MIRKDKLIAKENKSLIKTLKYNLNNIRIGILQMWLILNKNKLLPNNHLSIPIQYNF